MKLYKSFFLISFAFVISCGTTKYNYFKLSKLEKKKYHLQINSKNYNLSETILDKRNISEINVDKRDKKVIIKTFNEPKFVSLMSISDSINNKNLNLAVFSGLPFLKENFNKILFEHTAIESLQVIKVPLSV